VRPARRRVGVGEAGDQLTGEGRAFGGGDIVFRAAQGGVADGDVRRRRSRPTACAGDGHRQGLAAGVEVTVIAGDVEVAAAVVDDRAGAGGPVAPAQDGGEVGPDRRHV